MRNIDHVLDLKKSARMLGCTPNDLIAMAKKRFWSFPLPANQDYATVPPQDWLFVREELQLWDRSCKRKCIALLQDWFVQRNSNEL